MRYSSIPVGGGKTFDGTAKPSKRFDRVLGVVVVPRNTSWLRKVNNLARSFSKRSSISMAAALERPVFSRLLVKRADVD